MLCVVFQNLIYSMLSLFVGVFQKLVLEIDAIPQNDLIWRYDVRYVSEQSQPKNFKYLIYSV